MSTKIFTLATTAGLLLAGATGVPASASVHQRTAHHDRGVSVAGSVADPTTYSPGQLAALTQTTLPDLRDPRHPGRQLTGTLLEPLVDASGPVLPQAKNARLRVTLTVSGRHSRAVAVTVGELDPGNGNHPALLVAHHRAGSRPSGFDLVFPGDRGSSRTVRNVRAVEVEVAAPVLPTDVPAGAVRVVDGPRSVILSPADLHRLPTATRSVAFLSGQGPQQHLETGPRLAAVLRAAHVRAGASSTVAAIAGDGYVATVTPAEATAGRRPLLLATVEDGVPLDQPRLVADGDVSGGRYVTGVLALEVSSARGCR